MAGVALKLVVLKTLQLDRLRTFYQAVGVELVEERHGNGPTHYAGQAGDVVLEIYPQAKEGGSPDASVRLGFAVERLEEVVRTLGRAGEVMVSEPRQTVWGLRAVVRDPDGRTVELYQK